MYRGVDVSEFQDEVNWKKAKEEISFAIIRAGYGRNNIDAMATKNVLGCEENGIPYGLYWFSYAYTTDMARNEARYLINFIKGHVPLYPLYFDFEYDSERYANSNGVTVTKQLLNDMARAFCSELESAGYYAGIYANINYVDKFGEDIFNRYDLWLAQWEASKPYKSVNMWQCSSSGKVGGISGNVDVDYAYVAFPEIIKEKGLNGYKKEPAFKCPNKCPHCPHSNHG